MQNNSSTFNVPSFARAEAYVFPESEDMELFNELNKISEEVLECRAQNSAH